MALASLVTLAGPRAAAADDVAVIVHESVSVEALTFDELRHILLGDRQFWTADQRVTLLVREPPAEERALLLDKIYEMSEAQFRRYWIGKVFRAEATSGPKVVLSNDMAGSLVAAIPGAIALVSAGDVPQGVKVLRIDGHRPGEPGYPLAD